MSQQLNPKTIVNVQVTGWRDNNALNDLHTVLLQHFTSKGLTRGHIDLCLAGPVGHQVDVDPWIWNNFDQWRQNGSDPENEPEIELDSTVKIVVVKASPTSVTIKTEGAFYSDGDHCYSRELGVTQPIDIANLLC